MTDMKQAIRTAIQAFTNGILSDNALNLFDTLGYNINRRFGLSTPSYDGFVEDFPDAAAKMNVKQACVTDWLSIELLFQITSEEMQSALPLFEPTVRRQDPASYLFFCIELTDKNWTQNQLAQIVREINKGFPMHVFVLFKFGNQLSLSLIDRRPNKKVMDRDVLETVTHVHCIRITNPHSAHLQILYTFSLESLISESKRKRIENFADLQAGWRKVLSTQVLNKQFYLDYQKLSKKLIRSIYSQQQPDKLLAHQGVLNLLNRLMFVFFVQKKRWLNNDDNFLPHFWRDYQLHRSETRSDSDPRTDTTFHEHWLNTLFFYAFNGRMQGAFASLPDLTEPYQKVLIESPYLNGGLFAYNEDLDQFLLPDALFTDIFNYFEGYIFTISEDTPLDINLEINPELLGKMYEGMINATDLDDVDAENGIVYTERPEINFMVRRSLVEVLDKKLNTEGSPRKFSREFLYHFIFDEPAQKREVIRRYKHDPEVLRQAITSITACDPSCGSGSMLLGVIQVQMELIRTLDEYTGRKHTGRDDFQIKKQLISECIYGVDIKEWAVRIAELRLWLYMIAEADFVASELTKSPLLPNLDFKLRQGNSLLQKFGNMDFTAKALFSGRKRNMGATRQLNEFIKRKKAYITNQEESGTTYKKLKAEEFEVFQRFITELIEENVRKIKDIKRGVGGYAPQGQLFGSTQPVQATFTFNETEISGLEAEITTFKALRQSILTQGRLPFSYDIDFMEVFLVPDDPGFDLIIGNPPYVRQEEILPPEDAQYLEYLLKPENKAEKQQVSKALKEALSAKVFRTYPLLQAKQKLPVFDESGNPVLARNGKPKIKDVAIYGDRVPGRSDLYCYFQLLLPSYLNSLGTFCFIISNSWLDVEFGAFVQHFLLRHTHLHAIYDCSVRSFDAAVNTIIYLHGPLRNTALGQTAQPNWGADEGGITQFVMNKIDYELASYAPMLIEQENCRQNTFRELYRVIPLTAYELYRNGHDAESHCYVGDKWGGKYLRAPEIYYNILAKGKDKLIRLGDIANILPGCYAGIADFFYVNQKTIDDFKIEQRYLKPLLRNSDSISKLAFDSKQWFVLACDEDKSVMGTGIRKYIEWGEKQVTRQRQKTQAGIPYPQTESVKNRKPGWWSIPKNNLIATRLFMQYVGSDRFYCPFSSDEFVSDRSFHRIFFDDIEALALSLNSSLSWFFISLMGRSNLGEGALKYEKNDALSLLTLDPKLLSNLTAKSQASEVIQSIGRRRPDSIIIELGFDRALPIREQEPNPLPDRKALDDLIFDALNLTTDERREVYWAIGELVKHRLDKAASR
jgi:hypothetical protein